VKHATVVLMVLTLSCQQLGSVARKIGIASAEAPPPVDVVLVCDSGVGSNCTSETLRATLDVVLPYAARRPGSRVALWSVGNDPAASREIARVTSAAPRRAGIAAQRATQKRFVEESVAAVLIAAAPLFRDRARTQTPLFETITLIGLQPTRFARHIIVISDLREETPRTARTECADLPTATALTTHLHERGVLLPHLLTHTTLHLAFINHDAVEGNRCAFDVGRFAQLQTLWESTLHAAGADVEITTDAPTLED
jgi:hypothetical protein